MAKEYDDETIDFWDKFPKTFFDKFIKLAKRKVLDVGSGPGRDGLILQNRGLEVVCLDASEEMVKLCRARGLKAVLGDFNKLPFKNNYFDGVWAYTSLLHIPKSKISKPIKEIRRVLKNKGILGLGLIEGEIEGYTETAGINRPRWFGFYTKQEVEDLLKEHKFEILYFEFFKPKSKNYLNFLARKK